MAPYVAGKTGTTDDENDVWFVGFSNEVTVAVWVGGTQRRRYRRTLGSGPYRLNVAIPIFEPIMQAVWAHHSSRTALKPASSESAAPSRCGASRTKSIEVRQGRFVAGLPSQGRKGPRGQRPISASFTPGSGGFCQNPAQAERAS